MKEELIFQERQRFNQWWMAILLAFINGLFIYRCIYQVVLGKQWGNNPTSNTMLIIIALILLFFTLFFLYIRLDTVIDKGGIYFKMFPFHLRFKLILWDDISEAAVIKFNPLVYGGGWGLRFGMGYTTYTVSGFKALKLVLKNNKKIFIGTRRSEELSEFLKKLDAERNQEQKLRPAY